MVSKKEIPFTKGKGKVVRILGQLLVKTQNGVPVPFDHRFDDLLKIEEDMEVYYTIVNFGLYAVAIIPDGLLLTGTLTNSGSIMAENGAAFICDPAEEYIGRFNIQTGDRVCFCEAGTPGKAINITT